MLDWYVLVLRWWDDDVTPMLLVGDSAELWLRAGWRVRATVHGAVSGSTQLVLEVRELELPEIDYPPRQR